jgi:hypothetical protein
MSQASPDGSILAATHRGFALITRTARACASYPSCVAVYPRDSPIATCSMSLCPKAPLYLACSRSLDRYLTALPAMSLAPVAPFPHSRRVDAPLAQLRTATLRGLTVYPVGLIRLRPQAHPFGSSHLCRIASRRLHSRSRRVLCRGFPSTLPSLHLTRRVQETVQSWQDVARASTLRERSSQHYERTN